MADILAFNLTTGRKSSLRSITTPDMSTKLKLLGVEVASFGDAFADMFGPKWLPDGLPTGEAGKSHVKALTYNDPFGKIYKKYLFTPDGKYLLGGMMIGATGDYSKLLSAVKKQKQLETAPGELIVGNASGEVDTNDL
jgi:nitrite reductase (NAD(P)H)